MKIAIIFFGLTRSLDVTYNSIKQNLFDVLTQHNINYNIYMHTYHIKGSYVNPWSHERCVRYDNTKHKILNPKYLLIDDQDEVLKKFNMNDYYSKLEIWAISLDLTKYLIRNMVLALYSKKRITELFEKNSSQYDYVIIMRPDMKILNKFDVNCLSLLNDTNIIIPDVEHYSGYNDRICVSGVKNALYYGKLYDHLLEYSRTKPIASERFLFDMLKNKNIDAIQQRIDYEIVRLR
jgi:hypothetical protein